MNNNVFDFRATVVRFSFALFIVRIFSSLWDRSFLMRLALRRMRLNWRISASNQEIYLEICLDSFTAVLAENGRKSFLNICVCIGHGKLSFPLINKVLFIIGSEPYQVALS